MNFKRVWENYRVKISSRCGKRILKLTSVNKVSLKFLKKMEITTQVISIFIEGNFTYYSNMNLNRQPGWTGSGQKFLPRLKGVCDSDLTFCRWNILKTNSWWGKPKMLICRSILNLAKKYITNYFWPLHQ